jgi:hypothetical protein
MNSRRVVMFVAACTAMLAGVILPARAQQDASVLPVPPCRLSGRVTAASTTGQAGGSVPLPGVAILAEVDGTPNGATSTDLDGTYVLPLRPGNYQVVAELTGFDPAGQAAALDAAACSQTINFQLALTPRAAAQGLPPAQGLGSYAGRGGRGGTGARGAGAAGTAAGGNAQRFQPVQVETQAAAGADLAVEVPADTTAARMLLPPGFSPEDASDALVINGAATTIDRGMMDDRFAAIGRGEFDPAGLPGGAGDAAGAVGARFGGPGGPGRGGPDGGFGGRGGPGGRGGFQLAGRGARQNAYAGTVTYTFGGSPFDAQPYQLRPGTLTSKPSYAKQNFGMTFGGPVKIPGLYNGTRRTNFMVNYSGSRGSNLFDQYGTVPTDAMRAGDFSASAVQLVNPATGSPFLDNQIPAASISPTAAALLSYIPLSNLPGSSRNFHYTTTTQSTSDIISARVSHSFTPLPVGQVGGRGGGFGRGGGGGGGRGGANGRGPQRTNVSLTAQVDYRRNDNQQVNVFPTLGGRSTGSSLAVPLTLNIQHRRIIHNFTVNFSRTRSASLNRFAYTSNVAALAGVDGVASNPFDWGLPSLSFSGLTSLRDVTPSKRNDWRLTTGYAWTHPFTKHTLRAGGNFQIDRSANQTDANAEGSFVFTGLYSGGALGVTRSSGADFADFLLGLPQQASIQYGPGNVKLRSRSFSAYLQDEWRKRSNLTFNLGVRYELVLPYVEQNGRMVDLDAAPNFVAVVPVLSGGTGPFSGAFPDALVLADGNNVAPRVGVAWRITRSTILRGGYGVSYNAGSYSSIARQLVGQPPFAVTSTDIGAAFDPLNLSDPFSNAIPAATTNNYGIQKDYELGLVQTWNIDLAHQFGQAWTTGANYTETRGSGLDIVRAPNRGPSGIRIEGVQPFLWQTSNGSSILHAASFRFQRRPVKGFGGGVSYTLAKSRDNASSIGGGGTVVAQDDRNLAAEWGLSSFDRRHQLSTNLNVELPFGPNRPWLNGGGFLAGVLANWRATATFTWQSGTPLTPRVLSAASDVARGTNGTLRANYNGQVVSLSGSTIDRFFNTTAFSIPDAGTFGTASRNMIIGPGSRQLNAQLSRDVTLSGNRTVTIQLNATNLLNMVNYLGVDTVVNSPTFGEVLSVRPMRSVQLNVRFRY